MFKITKGQGFHVEFKNGLIVSVQFGRGNYCQNYHIENTGNVQCEDAEVAIFHKDSNKWFTDQAVVEALGEEPSWNVYGNVSPEQLLKLMIWAESQTLSEVDLIPQEEEEG